VLGEAMVIYKQIKDQRGQGVVLTNIGLVFEHIDDFERALELYNNANTFAKNRLK